MSTTAIMAAMSLITRDKRIYVKKNIMLTQFTWLFNHRNGKAIISTPQARSQKNPQKTRSLSETADKTSSWPFATSNNDPAWHNSQDALPGSVSR